MSVYAPLQDHLKSLKYKHWKASFAEIERVLSRPLPKSAYHYQAWWANQEGAGHSQTAAWRGAGWRTANLDLVSRTVEFERIERSEARAVEVRAPVDLLRKAAMYLGTTDEGVLYQEGLKALVEREAARRLARLGGSSPQLDSAPRRRSVDG
jgi:hypothetical protein